MDKATDFLKEIKNRFSSPLFSSFIIAWFFFNWQVPIALIFYKMDQLPRDGFNSYIELVKKQVNLHQGVYYPLISALAYTLTYPIVRNYIQVLHAWADRWGTDWSLRVAKSGKISVERYVKLRETYKSLTKTVESVLDKEADYVQKNAELTNEKLDLQYQLNNWKENHEKLRNYSNLNAYDGDWQITYQIDGIPITENATLANGNISTSDAMGMLSTIFIIKMVSYSSQSNEFIFLIQHKKETATIGEFFQIFRYRNPDNRALYSIGPEIIIKEMRRL